MSSLFSGLFFMYCCVLSFCAVNPNFFLKRVFHPFDVAHAAIISHLSVFLKTITSFHIKHSLYLIYFFLFCTVLRRQEIIWNSLLIWFHRLFVPTEHVQGGAVPFKEYCRCIFSYRPMQSVNPLMNSHQLPLLSFPLSSRLRIRAQTLAGKPLNKSSSETNGCAGPLLFGISG